MQDSVQEYIEKKKHFLEVLAMCSFFSTDNALEGHVISMYLVQSELDCLHRCLLHSKCLSLNFELHSSGSHRCQLNDATQLSSGHGLAFCDGCSYLEPIILTNKVRNKMN